MYGIGYISRTLNDTLQVGNGLGKLPPMRSDWGNAFVIDYVPLDEIYTDESNFQNRGDKYSEKSVKSIIDAVANGSFNWFAFDPVILWENPADGKKYVLSGHSRTQAFRQLAKMHPDWIVDGLTFTAMPARIYRGSIEDAKRLALNSNTLATPETLTERAAYYRRIRERQGITKGKDLKTLKDKALRENNGQMIWDLSYLPDGGISFDSLKAFKLGEESGSTENFLRLATICQWIGKAFQIYKGLSKAHDRELFNFLMSGGYGSKSGQYFNFSSLNDRLQKLYTKNVADDRKVNANGEYTEPFQIAAYKKDDATLDTLDDLKKTADGAYKELKRKLKELRDNNATREQIFEIATPYFNGWANSLYDWWSLLDRTPKTDNTPSLFGLGRVNPKLYFNDRLLSERMFQLAERIAEQAESAGLTEPQEIRNLIDTQIELQSFADWQEDDAELLEYLKKKVQNPYFATNVENGNTTPVTPSAADVRFTTRKWNRWARVQKLWGDFIDALALMVVPRDLISRYFKAIIIRPLTNEEKTFPDIAKALDFAFDKGQLNRNSWIILNDRNKAVLTNNDVPKSLDGILCGIFGVSGLGKPTIKFEFEDNQALADFLTKTKENVDYAETVDADTFSNPLNVNNRRQSRKAAQQKALTDTPSNYLPPSDGTPSLPPSPTSPKALPTASTSPTVPPLPSFDAVLKNDLRKSDWNRIGFKVGNVGYINDKLQYLDVYIPRYYDVIENWMRYAEYLYPNFVVALCRENKDKWIFAFDAKKYSKFLRQFFYNRSKDISFTQRFVFVYDVDLMEQVVKHFNDNGMQVALFYRHVYDGDQPEIITHPKAALPPYVKPTTAPTSTPSDESPEVTAESVTEDEIDTTNKVPVSVNFDDLQKRLANASSWSSFDPDRAASSDVSAMKADYATYAAQVPDGYENAFNAFFNKLSNNIIALKSKTASVAVTGSGGVSASKAERLNRNFDTYMQAWRNFDTELERYVNKLKRRAKRREFLSKSLAERSDDRIKELKADIDKIAWAMNALKTKDDSVLNLDFYRRHWPNWTEKMVYDTAVGRYRNDITQAKQTLLKKVENEYYKGHQRTVNEVVNYVKERGIYTPNSKIFGYYKEIQDFDSNAKADDGTKFQGAEIVKNEHLDRLQIKFDGKPSEEIRNDLKKRGFRWSPHYGVWQRQLTNDAVYDAKNILKKYFSPSLGKPTIKLEFEDNDELMSLFDTDGISGLTVNDKPAAVFNCPESELDTQGFAPTYIRLADYSHLIDAADGAKTLKGYGFEKATLDELINACQNYRQVERLAAHLKDDDEMQSAFNIWHWLHTNVRYNYDTPGEEEIRTPARVWADRESGVDCDCLAVFTACLLINQGFHPCFEIVAFNNSPTYSHIYVNLDGMAIDRVLPVFLARPGNITKTQIMEIPVYSLSGIDGCNTLSGVYASTLAKVQDGTATGEDLNNLRKTEVLLTLKGLDEDEYKLAKILMPYVVTIGDDGKYYFDNAKLAAVAQKVDAELALLKQQNASPEAMTQWLAKVLDQLDGVSVDAQTQSDEDTIVVIINPKGCPCHVSGQFVSTDLQTLTPDSSAASTADATASPSADSPLYATTPAPIATPPDEESESSNTWFWIAGISAAFGIGAALTSGKKKRR